MLFFLGALSLLVWFMVVMRDWSKRIAWRAMKEQYGVKKRAKEAKKKWQETNFDRCE